MDFSAMPIVHCVYCPVNFLISLGCNVAFHLTIMVSMNEPFVPLW